MLSALNYIGGKKTRVAPRETVYNDLSFICVVMRLDNDMDIILSARPHEINVLIQNEKTLPFCEVSVVRELW